MTSKLTLCLAAAAMTGLAGGNTEWTEALRERGDLPRATTELVRRVLADPNAQDALFNLGAIHERQRDWDAAADFYQRAASVSPASEIGRKASGRLAAVRRIAALELTAEGRGQLRYEVALARAAEARASHRSGEAMPLLQAALRTSPERWEAPAMIGAMLAEDGNTAEAANYLRTARRNAPAADRGRFDQAIEVLLSPSRHLFEASLANGARHAAAVARLSREMLSDRGGESIKEAAALLVTREIGTAVAVLREAASRNDDDALMAWRMLNELAPVSADARQAMTQAPAGFQFPPARPVDAILPQPVSAEMRQVAEAPPLLVERSAITEARVDPEPRPEVAAAEPASIETPATAPATTVVVQVGAYRDATRAEALARALIAKGFDARARAEGAIHRVVVDPGGAGESAGDVRARLVRDGFQALVRNASRPVQ